MEDDIGISPEEHDRLVTLMESCPFCHVKNGDIFVVHFHHFTTECMNCNSRGPVCISAEQAVKFWNRRF